MLFVIESSFTFYLNFHLVGVSDEALYSKEVFPEATDEHKGEDSDKVEILLEGEFLHCLLSTDFESMVPIKAISL